MARLLRARAAFAPSVSRGVGRGALWMRFCRAPGYCKRDLSKKFCMKSIFFASAVRADTEGAVLGGARPFARHAGRLLCLRSALCGQAFVPSLCVMRAGFCVFALRHAGRFLRFRPAPCGQVFAPLPCAMRAGCCAFALRYAGRFCVFAPRHAGKFLRFRQSFTRRRRRPPPRR